MLGKACKAGTAWQAMRERIGAGGGIKARPRVRAVLRSLDTAARTLGGMARRRKTRGPVSGMPRGLGR